MLFASAFQSVIFETNPILTHTGMAPPCLFFCRHLFRGNPVELSSCVSLRWVFLKGFIPPNCWLFVVVLYHSVDSGSVHFFFFGRGGRRQGSIASRTRVGSLAWMVTGSFAVISLVLLSLGVGYKKQPVIDRHCVLLGFLPLAG